MNMYCDNYSACNSMLLDQGSDKANEAHARAKGWHIWDGFTIGGKRKHVVLCSRCVESKRRALAPSPEAFDGQLNLFELVVHVGPEPQPSWLTRMKKLKDRIQLNAREVWD